MADIPARETAAQWQAHAADIEVLAFSPDGRLLMSAGQDRRVRLWERAHDRFVEVMTLPATDSVRSAAFSPDGKLLGVLSQDDRAVRVWHLDRLRECLREMGLE